MFGVSLWLAKDPVEKYGPRLRPTLEVITRLAPNAEIVARSSAGVVQAIQCYDRIGGQRDQMEGMNRELRKR